MATKDFITYTPDSGAENKIITVTVSENGGIPRSSSLEISGGGISKVVSIQQKYAVRIIKDFSVIQFLTYSDVQQNNVNVITVLDTVDIREVNNFVIVISKPNSYSTSAYFSDSVELIADFSITDQKINNSIGVQFTDTRIGTTNYQGNAIWELTNNNNVVLRFIMPVQS
jgi:hypothetical protein